MGNINYTRIILGTLRYKSAPETDIGLKVPFKQTIKEIVEYDRIRNVDLEQLFDDERQKSSIIRPTMKFSLIFQNAYTGRTNYEPFENNLYYVNELTAAANQCGANNNSNSVFWSGFPQYYEFDFIRNDNNVIGYTQPSSPNLPYLNHINFVNKSATSYNWMFYLSYGYENDYNKILSFWDTKYNRYLTWKVSDGIPIISSKGTSNGLPLISFRSPIKHGFKEGETIKFSDNFEYNSGTTQQVYSLGDGFYGSEEYVFNIVNYGFTGNTFYDGKFGTAKRVVLANYPNESTSEYYVRRNKILTNLDDAVLVKAGFEQSIFGSKRKYESSALTPNKTARVSLKEGSQSYTLSFNKDIDIKNLLDNQKRPLTELFVTVIFRGYFGWFLDDKKKIKNGYEFNLPLLPNGNPNGIWDDGNNLSNEPILTYSSFETIPGSTGFFSGPNKLKFYSTNPLTEGNIVIGDLCEWNNYTQEERVISNNYHKIKFNPRNFDISPEQPSNPLGYYYKPHHKITLRVYSDYIEETSATQIENLPSYAFYSTIQNSFIWRDLYTYGFIDSTGLGVDYPFLNGKHYPYESYFFRIIPEGTNYTEQEVINQPITDNCE
jgi:hypothetical protein